MEVLFLGVNSVCLLLVSSVVLLPISVLLETLVKVFFLVFKVDTASLSSVKHTVKEFDFYWSLSTILKTSNKSVWGNAFWYVKVYIFWNFIQYTILWEEMKMLN